MARVHATSWRQTYRGLMSDDFLDDPGLLTDRGQFWTAALTDKRYASNRVAVAEQTGQIVGIAMSGPPQDADSTWQTQLFVMYAYAAQHGSGVGRLLLDAVVDPNESAALWVADPNSRAQAFYRKCRFIADGTSAVQDGVRAIRMVRQGQ
jgi:L-amino acid N-acyltransferase YncA